jgi:hypothetical protein
VDHDSTFRTIMVRPCFPVSLSSSTTAEGSAVVPSKKSLNLHLHLHKPQPLKAVHPFNPKIWGVFLLSSGFRVTSAFDGNAVGARCVAKVPNPREVIPATRSATIRELTPGPLSSSCVRRVVWLLGPKSVRKVSVTPVVSIV